MTFRTFQAAFDVILHDYPLCYGHRWTLQRLRNKELQKESDWFEVLYRTCSCFQCNHGHRWESSWAMIVFRFDLNYFTGRGTVKMKRFGQRCGKCENDQEYHIGYCSNEQAWYTVQRLLLYILQRCYEGRSHEDADMEEHIIPVSDVPKGRFGGTPHPKHCCEACKHDRCQEMYRKLTQKK